MNHLEPKGVDPKVILDAVGDAKKTLINSLNQITLELFNDLKEWNRK